MIHISGVGHCTEAGAQMAVDELVKANQQQAEQIRQLELSRDNALRTGWWDRVVDGHTADENKRLKTLFEAAIRVIDEVRETTNNSNDIARFHRANDMLRGLEVALKAAPPQKGDSDE